MPKYRPDPLFVLQESLRNIRLNREYAFSFFIFLSLNYILLIIIFTGAININYFIESYHNDILSFSMRTGLIFFINRIVLLRVLFFILFLIAVVVLIYLNKKYINTFIILYRNEIDLVNRLSCNNNMLRIPLLSTAFIINLVSMGTVLLLTGFIYRYLAVIIEQYLTGFNCIEYQNFNISLLIFLSLITVGGIFSSSHYLFWKHKLG